MQGQTRKEHFHLSLIHLFLECLHVEITYPQCRCVGLAELLCSSILHCNAKCKVCTLCPTYAVSVLARPTLQRQHLDVCCPRALRYPYSVSRNVEYLPPAIRVTEGKLGWYV